MNQYFDAGIIVIGAIVAILSVLVVVAFVIRYLNWGKVAISISLGPAQLELKGSVPIPSLESKGLILLVGSSASIGNAVVRFHMPELQHCWVLERSDSPGIGSEIASRFANSSIRFHTGAPYAVEPYIVGSTRRVVDRILDKEVSATGLEWGDMVADVTGGTPPMVLGLATACGDRVPLEYVESLTDPSGVVDETTHVTPVFVGYYLAR